MNAGSVAEETRRRAEARPDFEHVSDDENAAGRALVRFPPRCVLEELELSADVGIRLHAIHGSRSCPVDERVCLSDATSVEDGRRSSRSREAG